MLNVYRSVVLIACIVILLLMTIQLFTNANTAAERLDRGGKIDTGIFPKRSRNVNAWYLSSGTGTPAYPIIFQSGPSGSLGSYQANKPARIGIPRTTACPIFRAQDDGSTNPLLIG